MFFLCCSLIVFFSCLVSWVLRKELLFLTTIKVGLIFIFIIGIQVKNNTVVGEGQIEEIRHVYSIYKENKLIMDQYILDADVKFSNIQSLRNPTYLDLNKIGYWDLRKEIINVQILNKINS